METVNWKNVLDFQLSKIDWKLKHCGCEHYVFVNNTGEETDIVFYGEKLTIKNHSVFGHSKKYADYVQFGYIVFYLKEVDIMDDTPNSISFVGKNNKSIFMTIRKIGTEFLIKKQ